MPRRTSVYNDDATIMSYLQPGCAREMVLEFLDWTTDRIPIDIYELCVATPDLCNFETSVGEVQVPRAPRLAVG